MNCWTKRAAQLPRRASRNSNQRFLSQSCPRQEQAAGRKAVDKERKHIALFGLPRSALPADVMRLARQSIKEEGILKNIDRAELNYNRFVPTGRAYLSLKSGLHANAALRALKNAQMSSLQIRAGLAQLPSQNTRRRGKDGKREAAQRGVLDGTGNGAGIDSKGCDVVLYGLPGTIAAPALRQYLRRTGMVKRAKNGEPDCDVIKIEIPRKSFSVISKHLVRLNSPSEAHAFVRKIHMTFFLPDVWGKKYLLRAKVVY